MKARQHKTQPLTPSDFVVESSPKMKNCTGNLSTMLRSACTLPEGLVVFFAALNIFLSMAASLGNALILIALHKVTSVQPPTKLLFRCLAVTDLCIGLITQPLYATILLSIVTKMKRDILYYVWVTEIASVLILCEVSIFTSTAISVDRLLALLLGLRYRYVVTLRRVSVLIIIFWLTGISIVFMNKFWNGNQFASFVAFGLQALSLVTSIFSYTRIFFKLRQHQAQVQGIRQGQPNGRGMPLNIARYKKTVSSIAWVQLALVLCYVPLIITMVSTIITGWSGMSANIVMISVQTIVCLNSSLNPILYCWRIKEVRRTVNDTVRKFYCSSS